MRPSLVALMLVVLSSLASGCATFDPLMDVAFEPRATPLAPAAVANTAATQMK